MEMQGEHNKMEKYHNRDKDLVYLACVICTEIDKMQKYLGQHIELLKSNNYTNLDNLFYFKDKFVNLACLP